MKTTQTLIVIIFLFSYSTFAKEGGQEEKKEKALEIKVSGYVKNDFFFDTRQTVSAREGQFLLWPSPKLPDAAGEDINAKPSLNFLALQSRITLTVTGPEVLGAKPSAVIEGDFFAQLNDNINLFRLRHAFIKLSWENTDLLTGQFWNPVFVTDCYPGTVSFNTGVPIQGLSRNPQIRITHRIGELQLMAAAATQRDFTSVGPEGKSSMYLRNAVIPEMHAQVQYAFPNVLFGGGVAYKAIVPRLSSQVGETSYKVDESVSGLSALGFLKISTKPVTLKFQARYGENNTDVLTISGYAVKEIANQETQERIYTPMTNTSFWGDIQSNGQKFQVGLFAGMVHNHGTKEAIDEDLMDNPVVYGFGQDIESIYRISPRAIYNINQLRLAMETELTVANYGSDFDRNMKPRETQRVENCRVLLAVYYLF
jgi:hypothetical protein